MHKLQISLFRNENLKTQIRNNYKICFHVINNAMITSIFSIILPVEHGNSKMKMDGWHYLS